MHPIRQTLSHLKTLVYRKPKDEFQRFLRWGPRAYLCCDAWAREMEAAAYSLPRPESSDLSRHSRATPDLRPPIAIWFLTGKRFWYQTAFCAWTFAKQSGREVVLNLVDDGSLELRHEEALRRIFPAGGTFRKDSVLDRIETLLPADRFPILRKRWLDYVNIRKLTDIHLGSTGVKLVLDSDMLFFRRPVALLAWWDGSQGTGDRGQETASETPSSNHKSSISSHRPSTHRRQLSITPFSPCLMTDCVESYGYSRPLMEKLAGAPIPPLLNVGICGLRSENLDWEELEYWCRALLEREGTSYYLEQALVAMIAARKEPTVMRREDYVTFPSNDEIGHPSSVLQHYVADSKPGYFGKAWRVTLLR